MAMHTKGAPPKVTAVLGPTNTGKTHFAIERMLAHKSGMIGLPRGVGSLLAILIVTRIIDVVDSRLIMAVGTSITAFALLAYALSRTGTAATPAFWPDVLTGVGAAVLIVAGLVVESWCRIPPDDRADRPDRTLEQR